MGTLSSIYGRPGISYLSGEERYEQKLVIKGISYACVPVLYIALEN